MTKTTRLNLSENLEAYAHRIGMSVAAARPFWRRDGLVLLGALDRAKLGYPKLVSPNQSVDLPRLTGLCRCGLGFAVPTKAVVWA